MALSKTNRIIILLVVDSAFFLLELIVGSYSLAALLALVKFSFLMSSSPTGYAVHSLALVADSFHMVRIRFD